MNPIDSVLNKVESLPVNRNAHMGWFVKSDLVAWLRDEVGPVVHDLQRRQRFREFARWPLDQLAGKEKTEVRTAIQSVAGLMGRQAKLLLNFLTTPAGKRLGAGFEPRKLSSGSGKIGGRKASGFLEGRTELQSSYPLIVGQLQ